MSISSAHIPLAKREREDSEVQIELINRSDAHRIDIERFIQVVFRRAYGAKISHFLPHLLSLQQKGQTLAALGIRRAAEESLFLETYLNRPIENVLAASFARPIDRQRVVEVGNLVSTHGGGARALIVTLAAYLDGARYDWAVFTATSQVRNNFNKLGITLNYLADADKTRLGEVQKDWGSYYDQRPKVVVVSVDEAARVIKNCIKRNVLFHTAQQVWREAFISGRQGALSMSACNIEIDADNEVFL